jgi:hypothetical protein
MSKTNACENSLLLLIFNNTDFATIGDAGGLQNSATAGSLYVSLHTADPGEAGTQATNETTYTGYARQAVARSGAGWTVAGNQVTNAAAITFPIGTAPAASQNITHVGVGCELSGATVLLYKCALATAIYSGLDVTPVLTISTGVVITED